jgi:tRNA(Glu) U13 pseudouridine synthase TruD
LKLRDFVIRKIPEITPTGNIRNLVAEVKKLNIEENEHTKVSFELPRGSYATLVIKKLFM